MPHEKKSLEIRRGKPKRYNLIELLYGLLKGREGAINFTSVTINFIEHL